MGALLGQPPWQVLQAGGRTPSSSVHGSAVPSRVTFPKSLMP